MTLSPNNNQNPISSIFQMLKKISHFLIKPWLKVSKIDSLQENFSILKSRVESIPEKDISRIEKRIQHIQEEFKTSKSHYEREISLLKRELDNQLKEDVNQIKDDVLKIKDSIRNTISELIFDLDRQIKFSNGAERKEIENRKKRLREALTKIDQAINVLPVLEQSLLHTRQAAKWLTDNEENLIEITTNKISSYSPELEEHNNIKLLKQELKQYLDLICIFLQKGKTLTSLPKEINVQKVHIEALSLMIGEIIENQRHTNNIDKQISIKIQRYFQDLINVIQK